MAVWEAAGTATRGGIRREVFFCPGVDPVYASLYAADPARPGPGLVVCPSWGHELRQSLNLCHSLARHLALSGGAGLVLHWPGHGDSGGAPEDTDMLAMAGAATTGLREARRRAPSARWGLSGIRVGSAAVALAAEAADAASLLLIAPALDPTEYFVGLELAGRRASLGESDREGWAFGHPLPRFNAPPDVAGALVRFRGPVACLVYDSETPDPLPDGVEVIAVPGSWDRTKGSTNPKLVEAALGWTTSLPVPAHG